MWQVLQVWIDKSLDERVKCPGVTNKFTNNLPRLSPKSVNITAGSILILAPLYINYSKLDPKWIHCIIKQSLFICKKQGIICINSFFIIDLGSFKCYLDTFITNLQLFYVRMGVTRLASYDNAEKPLHKMVIFYIMVLEAK